MWLAFCKIVVAVSVGRMIVTGSVMASGIGRIFASGYGSVFARFTCSSKRYFANAAAYFPNALARFSPRYLEIMFWNGFTE